jgi:hypothetical protein
MRIEMQDFRKLFCRNAFFLRLLLGMAIVLAGSSLWAQERNHPQDADLLARLSYDRTATMQDEGVRQVCVAVSRDGDYRMARMTDSGEMQRVRGKMSKEQLEDLKKLLESTEFRTLSGTHGGLIRREAENFEAEIPASTPASEGVPQESDVPPTRRLQWLNADGEKPFPESVAKVVDWLKHFTPTGAKPLDEQYRDICPSVGLRLLQPSVATNAGP